jgi:hypothetical protein
MATDLTISVEDRPGGLASIGEALGNAGVNMEGVCGLGFEGRGLIHICVTDAAKARQALDAAGIKVEGEADAILTGPFPGATQPGTLGAMARRIADAGINVRALYLATGDRGVVVTG